MVLDEQHAIAGEDYREEGFDVTPVSDPNDVSELQRYTRANALMTFIGDPYINQLQLRQVMFGELGLQEFDHLIEEPPPQQDPALELEHRKAEAKEGELALKARDQELRAEKQAQDRDQQAQDSYGEAAERQARIGELDSRTLKNLAQAEAQEPGDQLDEYSQEANQLSNQGIR